MNNTKPTVRFLEFGCMLVAAAMIEELEQAPSALAAATK
jgi:hypothetical protein